ncbi:MAG: transcriptional regulator MraZ [Tenuifilum sp.]|jgi:MraZ protein|uniref:Transcriptional regulator MraZ n=1 Tax=Tenuifilum thalassicum TaxID=2590900 RepID=A0A7D3XCQ0_9BACT|nr:MULTISPECIES: division/cell wall cluster transcriptional repressor MraZ [Tenuifilum]MDI3526193.1 transcriptional regulator MraZ [Tenuifilum sp.]QKG79212.1 division/cell wall cluster transcriptional repressor MraZ [Tenuifilum thalassicum]
MSTFIGDYECKVDEKGRVLFPASLRKQVKSDSPDRFVVKKDIYEDCLVLYPMEEWERQTDIIRKNTNPYNREHNLFLREFFRGTAEVSLDSNGRMLLPKRLLEMVGIGREIVMSGMNDKIEIWAKDRYENVQLGSSDFANLAERILGSTPLKDE